MRPLSGAASAAARSQASYPASTKTTNRPTASRVRRAKRGRLDAEVRPLSRCAIAELGLCYLCLPNHSNIFDMSDDMTCLHLKNFSYSYSLFFTVQPFHSNGFLPCVGGLLNQFYNVMAIRAKER